MLKRAEQAECPCCRQEWPEGRPTIAEIIAQLRLSVQQRAIVERLARRFAQWVSVDELVSAIYADDPDGGPLTAENGVSVQLARIRPRLAQVGLVVEGYVGRGSPGRRLVWASGRES